MGFIIFAGGPIIASFFLSFTQWDVITPSKLIGFKNYVSLLNDPLFKQALKVTLIYVGVGCPLRMVLALIIALFLNQKIKALSWYRTVYFLPCVIPMVAISLLWLWVFDPSAGVLNVLLRKFGVPGQPWLVSTEWVLPAFIIMSLWGTGRSMIIYLAGLQSIPTQLYEVAEIDGASRWKKFCNVTLPMITPIIFFNLIMSIIGSFQVFTQSYVMTQGGPGNASLFYVLYLYRNAFDYFRMGYACSLAWVLFLMIIFFTLLIFKSSPLWIYYEGRLKGK